jgi:glycine reductase
MAQIPLIRYLNQFFAGIGGEDKANVPLNFYEEPIGPGKRFQIMFCNLAKIVVTSYCGGNYFNEHRDEVLASIQKNCGGS